MTGRGFEVLLIDRERAPTEMTVLQVTMSALIFGGFGLVSIFYAESGHGHIVADANLLRACANCRNFAACRRQTRALA
ncbi:hypothetical protein AU193_07170 [Mycobacterium sp. GA-1285]|nr:hypothetical protein AU193_07170 [Mycobacterium sp. GA-1285]